ncbi:hypothetical protein AAHE18_19G097900 [Arachis hypogaea]
MVSAALVRTVIGIIGNVISFGLFFSPAPTFYQIIKKKSVEEFKPDPYIATVLNCAFWVFYGLPFVHWCYMHPHSVLVVTINGVGLVFEFVYLTIFYIYATNKGRRKVLFLMGSEVLFFAAVAFITLLVIKTNSVEYMPFWLSLTNFLNGVCWTTYALIHPFDIYVLVSNGIGALSGLIQLILYACYCSCNNGENNVVKGKIELV